MSDSAGNNKPSHESLELGSFQNGSTGLLIIINGYSLQKLSKFPKPPEAIEENTPLKVLIPHEYAVAELAESVTYESLERVRIWPIIISSIGNPLVELSFQWVQSRAMVSEAGPNP